MAAILPAVQKDFGFSNFAGGLLISAFLFGSLPLMPLFGYLGDRMNRLNLMFAGVIAWTLATVASAFATGYLSLLITRIAVGVGESSFLPNAPAVINAQCKGLKKTNGSLAVYNASVPIGGALGLGLGGYFAHDYGWRSPFIVGALLGIPVALLLWWTKSAVRDQTSKHADRNFFANLRAAFMFPRFSQLVIGFALVNFVMAGFVAWLPKLGVMRGLDLKSVNMSFGLITLIASLLGSAVGGLLGGRSKTSDTSVSKLIRFSAISALLASPFAYAACQVDHMNHTMVILLISQVLYFATFAPSLTAVMGVLPSHLHATGMALTILAAQIVGSLAAPPIVGFLADHYPLATVLSAISVVSVVGALVWLMPTKDA